MDMGFCSVQVVRGRAHPRAKGIGCRNHIYLPMWEMINMS
jgi:hypothetical protein